MQEFFQEPPRLANPWPSDDLLQGFLARHFAPDRFAPLAADLQRLGELAAGEMLDLARQAEDQEPRLVAFDAWGQRRDHIVVSPAWRRLHDLAAEHGVIASGYERADGPLSRLGQFARLYLYHPSSAVASCPLAMTDGCARVLELFGDPTVRERFLPHLLSRDPTRFWTSGQWMTERRGGSDVSGTETVAHRAPADSAGSLQPGGWRLYGQKFFTSATTAELALALARPEGAPAGSRGLALFLVELRDERGDLRGIRVHRLKDKLGTRALPTAELELDGAWATLIGEEGRGVATVATLLNITRLYNSVCAVADLRRGLDLARDYAGRRRVFGRALAEQPLHLQTLAELEAEQAGAFLLTFHGLVLLGREECGEASPADRALLRLLTPLAKLSTAKQAVAGLSEILEAFGGAGYVEDTGLPRLLRNAQVLPIWEGTTNVLALDVLRVLEKDDALPHLWADLEARLAAAARTAPQLADDVATVTRATARFQQRHRALDEQGRRPLEASARQLALGLARLYGAALLLDHAAWDLAQGRRRVAALAHRWVSRLGSLSGFLSSDPDPTRDLELIALGTSCDAFGARS